MSDIFNHELDAYDQFENDMYNGSFPNIKKHRTNYYKIRKYNRIVHETDKAILFNFDEGDAWIPKALISSINEKTIVLNTCFARKFINK